MRKPPEFLVEVQKWFGKMISQPLGPLQILPKYSPFGTEMANEAEKYLSPSPTLKPHQRIEIYHQQYWWRLLSTLHQNFPFVTRLFGYEDFNYQIAIPYLSTNLPREWALCKLGLTLPDWIKEHYREEDFQLVHQAAEIDAAALIVFCIKELKSPDFENMSQQDILEKKLKLQPHLFLFDFSINFFSLRETFLNQSVEYWAERPFPQMENEQCYFVLYRSLENQVKWKQLTFGEYKMLSYFKEKSTIQEALQRIESEAAEEAAEMLPLWFREWTYLKWFGEV